MFLTTILNFAHYFPLLFLGFIDAVVKLVQMENNVFVIFECVFLSEAMGCFWCRNFREGVLVGDLFLICVALLFTSLAKYNFLSIHSLLLTPYVISHVPQMKMKNGEIYRGLLLNAEDTMNMTLSEVVRTARNGQVSKLPTVYLRGSGVRFIALPDLLRNAPAFKKVANMKAKMEAERGAGGGEFLF